MAGRINTSAVLNNGWNSGANDQTFTGTITVDPAMEKAYDYMFTEDPVQLQEKQQTEQILYDIFKDSPYYEKYGGIKKVKNPDYPDNSDEPYIETSFSKKIERSDIVEVFYYTKEQLEKKKKLSVFEMLLYICEFYEFDYKNILDNVLSDPLKVKLYHEVHKLGHKKIIDETEALF